MPSLGPCPRESAHFPSLAPCVGTLPVGERRAHSGCAPCGRAKEAPGLDASCAAGELAVRRVLGCWAGPRLSSGPPGLRRPRGAGGGARPELATGRRAQRRALQAAASLSVQRAGLCSGGSTCRRSAAPGDVVSGWSVTRSRGLSPDTGRPALQRLVFRTNQWLQPL